MLYEIAHIIKDKFGFLWEAVELGNEKLFVLMHKDSLKDIPEILKEVSNEAFTKAVDKMLASDIRQMGEKGYQFFLENYTVQNTYDTIMKHFKK